MFALMSLPGCSHFLTTNAPPKKTWETYEQQMFSNCTNQPSYWATDASLASIDGLYTVFAFSAGNPATAFIHLLVSGVFINSAIHGSESQKTCVEFNYKTSLKNTQETDPDL
jgi:hypothetical protein